MKVFGKVFGKVFYKTLFMGVASLISVTSIANPSRVLIIRHAEKPTNGADDGLSPRGFDRAQALTKLFQRQPALAVFGLPVVIYAFKYVPGSTSHRGVQTAEPLASSLGQEVDMSFLPTDTTQLAQKIRDTLSYNHKTVMVVWKHSEMQALAQSLGVQNAPAWNANVFDRIWQIDYNNFGQIISFKDLPQKLLQGDSQ